MKKIKIVKFLCAVLAASMLSGCSIIQNLMHTEPQTQVPMDFTGIVDFVLHAEADREFRILQFTDIQLRDEATDRIPGRSKDTTLLTNEELYAESFYYIEEAVKRAQPDLILVTGDNVYGQFDDSGRLFKSLVDFMETLETPWAPVFGNHDNESAMGVTWQCQQFEEAEHCLFKRGNITGNSNYTIGIEQGGKLIKVIYMMDSNGCGSAYSVSQLPDFTYNEGENIKTTIGLADDQLQWLNLTSSRITGALHYTPSKFLAMHINPDEFVDAALSKGYMTDDRTDNFVIEDPTGVDFGMKYEPLGAYFEMPGLWDMLKKHRFDGIFCGHQHTNNVSMLYDGIRLTYGLKTGTMDYHRTDMQGGTLITVAEGGESFRVQHIYIQVPESK